MASPSTLAAEDLRAIEGLLGLRLVEVSVRDARPETRLRFNSPVEVVAWTLQARAVCPDGRIYAGEIELFQWPRDGWELVQENLSPVQPLRG